MIRMVQEIFEKALERLGQHLTTFVPPLLVAVVILLGAFLLAKVVRWLILKAVKGIALDRFLRETGLSSMLDRSGRVRGASVVAGVAYWSILGMGLLTATLLRLTSGWIKCLSIALMRRPARSRPTVPLTPR